MNLDITTHPTSPESVTVRVVGDVDYLTSQAFVTIVTAQLVGRPALRYLRFDLTGLTICDSAGLSGFIQVHRQTSAAAVHLHFDNAPAHFDRLLDLTGTREYLTAAPSDERRDEVDEERYEGGGSNN